jgi:uncharacterized membrane protein
MAKGKFILSTDVSLTIVFWGSVSLVILYIAIKRVFPNVNLEDVGLSQKNVIGYCITAFFACLWYPVRKKIEGVKSLIPKRELYIRIAGIASGTFMLY